MKRILPLFLFALMIGFSSCTNDVVYSEFFSISSGKWHMDSVLHFDYSIADTTPRYTTILRVRHKQNYPYQNMWLFVGDSTGCDTIHFNLADERGNWLGAQKNGMIEMPVVFGENLHFVDTGKYYLAIRHGMRDTILPGVMDIGLEIHKDGKK